jgi:hypothetical protein
VAWRNGSGSVGPTRRGRGLAVFGLLFVVLGAWAVATPLYGGPDEPAHVIRADSLVHGELLGRPIPGQPKAVVAVHTAEIYTSAAERLGCWPFYPDNTPACSGAFVGSSRRVPAKTHVGRYNPVYYAVVGVAALFSASAQTVYLMRLTGAAVSAALLTLAALVLLDRRRASVSLLGLAFAFTPMAAFLAAVVNPSGVEISGAIALWASGLVALDPGTPRQARGRAVAVATLGACALVTSRGLSVAILGLVVALVLVAVSVEPRHTVLGDRTVRRGALVVSATTAASVGWVAWAHSLAFVPVNVVDGTDRAVRLTLGATDTFTRGMIGLFQWLDTPAPVITYYTWIVAVGVLALLGLVLGPGRVRLALALAIAVTFLVPFVQVPKAASTGLIWGGRYSLPLAAGVPVLAAYGLSLESAGVVAVVRRLGRLLAVGWGVGVAAAFYWAGHRNAVGASGPVFYLGRERWSPPVPYTVLVVLAVGAIAALVVLFLRLIAAEERAERPSDASRPDPVPVGGIGAS